MKTILKYAIGIPAGLIVATGAALAVPAQVTTDLNLRQGPGTDNAVIVAIPANTMIDMQGCLQDRSWCQVSFNGQTGWASSNYLAYEVSGAWVPLPQVAVDVTIPVVSAAVETAGNVAGAVLSAPATILGALLDPVTVDVAAPPATVRTYVRAHPVDAVRVSGDLRVGVGLPAPVTVHAIPDYDYQYAVVNGRTVLVRPSDRRVVYIYD